VKQREAMSPHTPEGTIKKETYKQKCQKSWSLGWKQPGNSHKWLKCSPKQWNGNVDWHHTKPHSSIRKSAQSHDWCHNTLSPL